MAYPRYIKKDGKVYGPYYYKSIRDENGNVRNVYVGTKDPDKNKKTLQISSVRTNRKFVPILLTALILVLITASPILQLSSTGFVIYSPNENIYETFSIEVNEFVPHDAIIHVQLENQMFDSEISKIVISPLENRTVDNQTVEGYNVGILDILVNDFLAPSDEGNHSLSVALVSNLTEIASASRNIEVVIPIMSEITNVTENETENITTNETAPLPENTTKETNITDVNITQNITNTTPIELNETNTTENIPIPQINETNETVEINVTEEIVNETVNETESQFVDSDIDSEEITQYQAEINKPVKWVKKVKLKREKTGLKVKLPSDAKQIKVEKVEGGRKRGILQNKIKALRADLPIEISDRFTGNIVISERNWLTDLFRNVGKIAGFVTGSIVEEDSEIEIEIEENLDEVEIEYFTEGPKVENIWLSPYRKKVTVYSDIHYQNVLTYTDVNDVPIESLSVFRLTGNSKEEFTNVEYLDENGNGLIDKVQWVTPHLSNQTFEININVINVQSYPEVGGNWSVLFETNGTANLTISAINGTSFSRDLNFLELKCGNTIVTRNLTNGTVFVEDWSCGDRGKETSHVLTSGKHHLEFKFGNMVAYANNFAGTGIAWLQGTRTETSLNINYDTTLRALQWYDITTDDNSFEASGVNLTVKQDGDYFVAFTIPMNRDDTNNYRSCVESVIYVNDVKKDIGVGRSSYIRGNDGTRIHYHSSDHMAVLLEDLNQGDNISVRVRGVTDRTGASYETLVDGAFSLYAEHIADTETVFTATATQTNGPTPTNLNLAAAELVWAGSRKDAGYTHSDVSSPEDITLDEAGYYLVTVNVPLGGAVTRANVWGRILIGGTEIDGGSFKQGYIRNTNSHVDSSIHWAGLVETSSPSQVLSVSVELEAAAGTVTVDGEKATIFIQKLPTTGIYNAEATQVNPSSPSDDWNPVSKQDVIWGTDNIIDTDVFEHTTITASANNISVKEAGQYLVILNGAFHTTGFRENPRMSISVNGNYANGSWSQTAYIRDSGGQQDSSDSMVFLLNLSANDNITVGVELDSQDTAIVDDTTPTIITIIKKESNFVPKVYANGSFTETPSIRYNRSATFNINCSEGGGFANATGVYAIVQDNTTGEWTQTPTSGTNVFSNVSYYNISDLEVGTTSDNYHFNVTVREIGEYFFRAECNQTDAVGHNDTIIQLSVYDDSPPVWSGLYDNDSNPATGDEVNFSTYWQDDYQLDTWIFSWNATVDDSWQNMTFNPMTGKSGSSNATMEIPNYAAGKKIGYMFYANDTYGNVEATSIGILEIQSELDFVSPLINEVNATPWYSGYGQNVTIYANVTDNIAIDASSIYVNITYPNSSTVRRNLSYVSGDIYEAKFNDTWQKGNYSFWIYVEDSSTNSNDTSDNPMEFELTVNASVYLKTDKDQYGPNSKVQIVKEGWWNYSWDKRKEITLQNAGSSQLMNFPAYLNVSYDSDMLSNYNDLRFFNGTCISDSGIELPYEIENYTSQNADIWIKIPVLETGDTTFCMYYDNPDAENGENKTGVWDSDYVAVWHFSEGDTGNRSESTTNNYEAAPRNYDGDEAITGRIGGADRFNGSSDYLALGINYNTQSLSEITTCVWFRTSFVGSGYNDNWAFLDFDRSEFFDFYIRGDSGALGFSTDSGGINDQTASTTGFNDGNWHFGCAVYDGTDKILYIDGEEDGTVSNPHSGAALGGTTTRYGLIGDGSEAGSYDGGSNSIYYDGDIDDIRYSTTTRSADWINVSYQLVIDQSNLVSFGQETSKSGGNINNTGPTNTSGFLKMKVLRNGTDELISIQFDDIENSTRRQINSLSEIDLGIIWAYNPWNTTGNTTGYYKAYAELTDPYGNILLNASGENISGYYVFYIDNDAPNYTGLGANVTTPDPLDHVQFYSFWDDSGTLGSWTFQWNVTGDMINNGTGSFSETPDWANITRVIPSNMEAKTIAYRFIGADSDGNQNTTINGTIVVNDITPPSISSEIVTPTNVNRYNNVDINATVTDNSGNVNGSVAVIGVPGSSNVNTTMNALGSDNYGTVYQCNEIGEYNVTVYANDSSYNEDKGTVVKWNVSGWSSVTFVAPQPGSYPKQGTLDLLCKVTDSNTSSYIENYVVTFWYDSTQIGTAITNSTGEAEYNWDTSELSGGNYYVNCTITDNATLFYNASENSEDNIQITILVPEVNTTLVEHENEIDNSINEYDSGDTISWVNVTVNNTGGSPADNVNVSLRVVGESWFDTQSDTSCGTLSVGEECKVKFGSDTIPTTVSAGIYNWNVTINWTSGGTTRNENLSSTFTVHYIPDNMTSVLLPTKVNQNQSSIYNITITNPWSSSITQTNVTLDCISSMNCTCLLTGQTDQTYCNLGSIGAAASKVASFNITTNESTVPGDYPINATVTYTNPGNEERIWDEQSSELLNVRGPTKLNITLTDYDVNITRGNTMDLKGYVNNTGPSVTNDLWINWTLPNGWTNTTGNRTQFNQTLCSNCILWNNITASAPQSVALGQHDIELKGESAEESADWRAVAVNVYANTSVSFVSTNDSTPYRNSTILVTSRLEWDNGSVITGKDVSFIFDGSLMGTNTTNSTGEAVLNFVIPYDTSTGSNKINVTYSGSDTIFTHPSWNESVDVNVVDVLLTENVSASPVTVGHGQNVTLSVDVWGRVEIDTVRANVSYPNGSWKWINMSYSGSGNTYNLIFEDAWEWGDYSYWVSANNTAGFSNDTSATPYSFYVRGNATLFIQTENDLYGSNQKVYLNSTDWFNTSWEFRLPINITEKSGENLTEYAVNITIDTQSLIAAGKMESDCSDMRFTKNDRVTKTGYWIESTCNSANTAIFVNVDVNESSNTTIYMYYGNPDATSESEFSEAWRTIGEANATKVNTTWHHIELNNTYNIPVVVNGPADYAANFDDEVVGRIDNVTSNSFEFKLQEPYECSSPRDDIHPYENISYIVIENGSWEFYDGHRVDAGNYTTSATSGKAVTDNWDTMTFKTSFGSTPVVVSQSMDYADNSFIKTRHQSIGTTSFQVSFNGDEQLSTAHGPEMLGWIATTSGTGTMSGVEYQFGSTASVDRYADYCVSPYECSWATQALAITVSNPPVVVAGLQAIGGGDNAYIRYNNPTTTSLDFGTEEDNCDGEKSGATETVGWMIFASPTNIYGRQLITTEPTFYSGTEEKLSNILQNNGSTNMSGFMLMEIQTNHSSSWVTIDTRIDQTSPINVTSNTLMDISGIWNDYAWNTTDNVTGYYRVYAALRDIYGNVLRTDNGDWVNNTYIFKMEVEGPDMNNIKATPQTTGFGQNVKINATLTDSSGVSQAKVNLIYPNGSTTTIDMTNTVGNTWEAMFNYTWRNGKYNYSIWARDNFGDSNESSSEYQFFVRSNLTADINTTSDVFSQYSNVTVSSAFINNTGTTNSSFYIRMYVRNDTTYQIISSSVDDTQTQERRNLTNGTYYDYGSLWNNWNTTDNETGYYSVFVSLTDPSGFNLTNDTGENITAIYTFYIDADKPIYEYLSVNNSAPDPLDFVEFVANWSDNYDLNEWRFEWNVTGEMQPNASGIFSSNPDWSNITRRIPASMELKTIAYRFYANDTVANENVTVNGTITVNDVTAPVISNEDITPNQINRYQTVEINATATDNSGSINNTMAVIGLPESYSYENESMTLVSGSNYGTVYQCNEIGEYNVTVYANDSSYNEDKGTLLTWEVFGWSNISWILPNGGSYSKGDEIILNCFVADVNTTSGIEAYPVTFWDGETQIGTNFTNASGHALYNWSTTGIADGEHTINCTIADNAGIYYNVSLVNNAYTTITMLEPDVNTIALTHENIQDFSINEYETGDTIEWINVTVNNTGGSPADNVNVSLRVVGESWFDTQSNTSCGTLSVGEECEVKFGSDTIPTTVSAGIYNWNVTVNWTNGGNPPDENLSATFVIHHVPDNMSSVITPNKVLQNASAIYNVTLVNPWSQTITNANVSMSCGLTMNCTCLLTGQTDQTYCNLGSIGAAASKVASFNITTNESTVPGDQSINATVEYTNPSGEARIWNEQENQILGVRGPTKLNVTIYQYDINVTRGSTSDLKGYVNNTGAVVTNNLWLNWTLPNGWTNTTGNRTQFNQTLCSNCILWNNITASISSTAPLGQKEAELRAETDEEAAEWTTLFINVYSNTVIDYVSINNTSPYRNSTVRLNAKLLWDNGSVIQGETLAFSIKGVNLGSNTTNSSGYAILDTTIPYDTSTGSNNINVTYSGSNTIFTYQSSNESLDITVNDLLLTENVTSDPQTTGFGQNVTLSADVWGRVEVDSVKANVTHPNGSSEWIDMSYSGSGNSYTAIFTNTWKWGDYSYWISANNTVGFSNDTSTSPSTFYVRANANIELETEQYIYGTNQNVSLDKNDWWNKSWKYSKKINISETTGSDIDNYQVNVTLNTSYYIGKGKMQSDCDDIRFVLFNDSTESYQDVSYWFDYDTCDQEATEAWVKIPKLIANDNVTIYLYYGNPSATDNRNISSTFVFGDDFNRANNDVVGNSWTEDYPSYSSVESEQLKIDSSVSSGTYWRQVNHNVDSPDMDYVIEYKGKTSQTDKYVYANYFGNESNRRASMLFGSSAVIQYLNGAAIEDTSKAYSVSTSYNFKIWYKKDSGTFSYYVDSDLEGADKSSGTTTYTNEIAFGGVSGSTTYWDDVRIRKLASSEPIVTIFEENGVGSEIRNKGTYNISGYLIMQIRNATTGEVISERLNDTETQQKRTVELDNNFDIADIWDTVSWNTTTTSNENYTVYVAFTDPWATVFKNDTDGWMNNTFDFHVDSVLPQTSSIILNSSSANNYTFDSLHCWAMGIDNEASTLTAYWQWWNGTQLVLYGNTEIQANTLTEISVLEFGNTTAGEEWNCSVKMSDGVNNETTWQNESIDIENYVPILTSVDVIPLSPSTTDTLDCGAIGYDLDDDQNLFTNFTWFRDTGSGYTQWTGDDENDVATSNDTYVNTSATGDLEQSDTVKNYKFKCQATLYDEMGGSILMNSSEITIQNTAPSPDSSWSPSSTHDTGQDFTWSEGSDDDGDSITSFLCIDDDSTGRDNEVCDTYSTHDLDSPVSDVTLTYGGATKTYYGRLVANDGEENSTNYDFTFTITNAQPTTPSTSSLDGQSTTDATPTATFTKGTDSDTSPVDTLTQFVSVDSSGYTDSGSTYTTSGDISEFTIPTALSDGTYYVRQWTIDNTGASNTRSSNYEYTFSVNALLTINSITIEPDEGDPGIVINPVESSNKTINITVTVTNTTEIDTCEIRIFNSTQSYADPVLFYDDGIIQNCGATCDCFKSFGLEYWRNNGTWNISVDMQTITAVSNATSEIFTYNTLTSLNVNTTTITFAGIPDQTVNSNDAYPLEIKNTGNQMLNVTINGSDFVGVTYPSYIVSVGNVSYNNTKEGSFEQLSSSYTDLFYNVIPAEIRYLYFRAYLPIGFVQQDYQSIIEIRS